eukprot:GHVN01002265.1.p1 GENE.GHVN01002265.1~~GHVN01002265.1.p1  ORF type:complete len:214 (-),score=13.61 GHVN01002265.1:377-1018(-)
MICPEFQYLWKGVDSSDSIVVSAPTHKWLGVNFNYSFQFLKDGGALQRKTMTLRASYLETPEGTSPTFSTCQPGLTSPAAGDAEITNFSEWTIPLGRRFRALKLWFVIRAYGLEGLRERIRNHVKWSKQLEQKIGENRNFRMVNESRLSLFTFQYRRNHEQSTIGLLHTVNKDGRIFLSHTMHQGEFVIRTPPTSLTIITRFASCMERSIRCL